MSPEILVFTCNWDGWSCIEAAANMGLCYPASVKPVKVNCISRVHVGLILKAFDLGAEGVMLLGCEPNKCHFSKDGKFIASEYEKANKILELLGVSRYRLALVQLPIFDGRQFVEQVAQMIQKIEGIPPAKRSKLIQSRKTRSTSTRA